MIGPEENINSDPRLAVDCVALRVRAHSELHWQIEESQSESSKTELSRIFNLQDKIRANIKREERPACGSDVGL